MTNRNRTRGTIVRQLDRSAVSELALAKLREQYPDAEWTAATQDMTYAIGETTEGQLALICSEGVGWIVSDETPGQLDFMTGWIDNGERRHSMTPTTRLSFTGDELRQLAATGQAIDLADLVREFGDRLEVNFSIWHRQLTAGGSPSHG